MYVCDMRLPSGRFRSYLYMGEGETGTARAISFSLFSFLSVCVAQDLVYTQIMTAFVLY